MSLPPSKASQHLSTCNPYCSKCFYKNRCLGWAKTGEWAAKHRGKCQLAAEKGDVEMVGISAPAQTRTVCTMCAEATLAEQKDRLEKKVEMEVERVGREAEKCAICVGVLSGGPRWWVCCGGCYGECPSKLHPSWSTA